MMSVAEEIRNHLAVRDVNYSITELAKRMKTSRPNLSNVISGRRWLSVEMAFKFEKYCGLDAAVLLHRQLDQQIERERNGRRRSGAVERKER